MSTLRRKKRTFPVAGLMLMVFLCTLGFWQIDRGRQKEQWLQQFESRRSLSLQTLQSVRDRGKDTAGFPLKLQGNFINAQTLLLDNRIMNGRPGYNVITPFLTEQCIVLVDRGWIPANPVKSNLPHIPLATQQTTAAGTTYLPPENAFTLVDDDYTQPTFPMVIQKVEIAEAARLFDAPVMPFLLRQQEDIAEPFVRDSPHSQIKPEKNYAYAFQWFAMAAAVLVLSIRMQPDRQKLTSTTGIAYDELDHSQRKKP